MGARGMAGQGRSWERPEQSWKLTGGGGSGLRVQGGQRSSCFGDSGESEQKD